MRRPKASTLELTLYLAMIVGGLAWMVVDKGLAGAILSLVFVASFFFLFSAIVAAIRKFGR